MIPGYPPDWPKCPSCGEPALDGHLTCGKLECDEGGHRNLPQDPPEASGWPS